MSIKCINKQSADCLFQNCLYWNKCKPKIEALQDSINKDERISTLEQGMNALIEKVINVSEILNNQSQTIMKLEKQIKGVRANGKCKCGTATTASKAKATRTSKQCTCKQ